MPADPDNIITGQEPKPMSKDQNNSTLLDLCTHNYAFLGRATAPRISVCCPLTLNDLHGDFFTVIKPVLCTVQRSNIITIRCWVQQFCKNKTKVNPDQQAGPNYNWRKHILENAHYSTKITKPT